MTLIEKLLRYQTIQGPYLGENRQAAAPVAQNFAALVSKPAAPAPLLQSAAQQLQINLQVKTAQVASPQAPQLMLPTPQLLGPSRLSPTTIIQIQQHPVECRFDLRAEELLLLEMLKRQGRKRPVDQLVPSAHAQLTWLPMERPFNRLSPSRRKLSIRGISFLRFRFSWEDDEAERRDPRDGRPDEPHDPWELLAEAAQ